MTERKKRATHEDVLAAPPERSPRSWTESSIWRRERMPVMTTELPYFDLAPDWVCEVLSDSTKKLDRVKKVPIYARSG